MAVNISKLEEVDLRDLWAHEAHGFSAWLSNNLDRLGDRIGLTLLNPQREEEVGSFSVDLTAETEDNGRVVIENQLEQTDHGHLGQVITYLTNLEAKVAIWICRHARPEHIRAVTWLNEISPEDVAFYLVKLEAYRIANSDPAPLFTLIVGPSAESRDIGKQKKELAERHIKRLEFWEGLLARAKAQGVMWHAQRTGSKDSWLGAGAGLRSGLSFVYTIYRGDDEGSAVELYIDVGNQKENKEIFDRFAARKGDLEAKLGHPVDWDRLDERRASRIRDNLPGPGLDAPKADWPVLQDKMIAAMDKFVKAIKGLNVQV
ncbi:MAG: DUF4268 domain-containing protein [Proteobacteria bacterium]|nr:DUF4268 domain-containing protein [Pseudomonadota bacterium]